MRGLARVLLCLGVAGCGTSIGDRPGSGPDGGAGGADSDVSDPGADAALERVDFTPSNLGDGPLTAGTDALVITAASSPVTFDTDSGELLDSGGQSILPAGVLYQQIDQNAPGIGVLSATDVVIEADVELRVVGGRAFALAASGDVTIRGTIIATGGRVSPETPGPGGFAGGTAGARAGTGPGGGGGGSIAEAGSDSGGGGGGHGGLGGDGGDREGGFEGGDGGADNGDDNLIGLVGGSGGGAGGGLGPVVLPGRGGGGGGAVQISARGVISIRNNAGINAGGGGGEGGAGDDAGGGGGAGGAVLLEALSIQLVGAVAANGGAGGAGGETNDALGASGQAGQLSDIAAAPGVGVLEGVSGGPGAAGATLNGTDGQNAQNDDDVADNAGGGGGGAGRIVFRSRDAGSRSGIASPPATELGLP